MFNSQRHADLKRMRSKSTVANAAYVAKLAIGEIEKEDEKPHPKKAGKKAVAQR